MRGAASPPEGARGDLRTPGDGDLRGSSGDFLMLGDTGILRRAKARAHKIRHTAGKTCKFEHMFASRFPFSKIRFHIGQRADFFDVSVKIKQPQNDLTIARTHAVPLPTHTNPVGLWFCTAQGKCPKKHPDRGPTLSARTCS